MYSHIMLFNGQVRCAVKGYAGNIACRLSRHGYSAALLYVGEI